MYGIRHVAGIKTDTFSVQSIMPKETKKIYQGNSWDFTTAYREVCYPTLDFVLNKCTIMLVIVQSNHTVCKILIISNVVVLLNNIVKPKSGAIVLGPVVKKCEWRCSMNREFFLLHKNL